jgi:hypothetical protein
MTQDELKSAIETVKRHQKWRKGADTPQISPKELTWAINILTEAAGRYLDLMD